MLIITREAGQSFSIGDDIEVFILKTGSEVRVGMRGDSLDIHASES